MCMAAKLPQCVYLGTERDLGKHNQPHFPQLGLGDGVIFPANMKLHHLEEVLRRHTFGSGSFTKPRCVSAHLPVARNTQERETRKNAKHARTRNTQERETRRTAYSFASRPTRTRSPVLDSSPCWLAGRAGVDMTAPFSPLTVYLDSCTPTAMMS